MTALAGSSPDGGGFPVVDSDSLSARSLAELAVHRLRAEIISGELGPGERLVEEHLTRRFGTSRAPLREALRLLGEQGLVEHLPRRGVRVIELSSRDVDELFSLRDMLERFAMGLALAGGTGPDPARMPKLTAALSQLEDATCRADPIGRAEAHRRFHLALVALAGHQHLLRVYEPVVVKLQLCMATNLRREAEHSSPLDSLRRHRVLHDAVAAGSLDLVLETLSRHGARTYLDGVDQPAPNEGQSGPT